MDTLTHLVDKLFFANSSKASSDRHGLACVVLGMSLYAYHQNHITEQERNMIRGKLHDYKHYEGPWA